jgi:hypothetical protein
MTIPLKLVGPVGSIQGAYFDDFQNAGAQGIGPIQQITVFFTTAPGNEVCAGISINYGTQTIIHGDTTTALSYTIQSPTILRMYGSADDSYIYRLCFETLKDGPVGDTYGTADNTVGVPFEINIPSPLNTGPSQGPQNLAFFGWADGSQAGNYLRAVGLYAAPFTQGNVRISNSSLPSYVPILKLGTVGGAVKQGLGQLFDDSWGWRNSVIQAITIVYRNAADGLGNPAGVVGLSILYSNQGLTLNQQPIGGGIQHGAPYDPSGMSYQVVLVNDDNTFTNSIQRIHGTTTPDGTGISSIGFDLCGDLPMVEVGPTGPASFEINIPDPFGVVAFWGWLTSNNLCSL